MRQLALLPPRRMEFTGIAIKMLPLGALLVLPWNNVLCAVPSTASRSAPVSQASAPER